MVVPIIVYMKLIVMSRIPWIDERERQTDRQTALERQTDRETERNREGQRERQRQTETERQTERRQALVEFLLHLGDERVYFI